MTYRQVVRGAVRAVHAAERENRRRETAAAKAADRAALLQASSNASAAYANMLEQLSGAHRVEVPVCDWATAAAKLELPPAAANERCERAARYEADSYSPGWLARTSGAADRRRQILASAINEARERDAAALRAADEDVRAHNAGIVLAQRVVAREPAALIEAIDLKRLAALPFSLERIRIVITSAGRAVAFVDGLNSDAMPTQSVSLLQSGKASFKTLPAGRVAELHRDNICSATIRVAIELLHAASIETIEVLLAIDLLDPATGNFEHQPVAYLRTTANALAHFNLTRTDAHPLFERLGGRMSWQRRTGFSAIDVAMLDLPSEPDD